MNTQRFRRQAIALVVAALCTIAQAQERFDVDNAAGIEGVLRATATRCMEPDFATRFINVSKALVAFSLQGDGPLNPAQVEALITRYANDPRFDDLDVAVLCEGVRPKLQALYKTRLISLQESQRAAEALRELNDAGEP